MHLFLCLRVSRPLVNELFYPAARLPWQFFSCPRMACVSLPGMLGLCRLFFLRCPLYDAIPFASAWVSAVAEFWAPFTEGELPWQWFFLAFLCSRQVYVSGEDVFQFLRVPLDGGGLMLPLHEVAPGERVSDILVACLRGIKLW